MRFAGIRSIYRIKAEIQIHGSKGNTLQATATLQQRGDTPDAKHQARHQNGSGRARRARAL